MTALAQNLERVEEAIAAACRKAGRARSEVELMAVSKTYPAATILEAAGLGLGLFGENRVQEFASKSDELASLRLDSSSTLRVPRKRSRYTAMRVCEKHLFWSRRLGGGWCLEGRQRGTPSMLPSSNGLAQRRN